jgi:hypothetical protein
MEYPVLATLSSLVVGLVYHRLSTPLVNSIERVVRLVVRSLTPARRSPTLTP